MIICIACAILCAVMFVVLYNYARETEGVIRAVSIGICVFQAVVFLLCVLSALYTGTNGIMF